jgi:hypothetical protein
LVLLMLARRAVLEFTLRVARPELSAELRAAWLALQRLDSARERPEMQLERLQVRRVEQQASRRP